MNDLQTNAVFGDITPLPGFSEPVSSWLHLIAAAVALVGSWRYFRPAWRQPSWRVATAVFVASSVFLFAMSGTYHLLEPDQTPRAVLQRLDHAAIWLLIAGTFTPIHIIATRGIYRWGVLGVVWSAAILGLVLKTVYFHEMSELVGLIFYLALGWMGVVTTWRIWKNAGWHYARWMIWGGIAYSIGAVLEFSRWPTIVAHVVGPHELFHIAVIMGVGMHFVLVRSLAERTDSAFTRGAVATASLSGTHRRIFVPTGGARVRPSRRVPSARRGKRFRSSPRSEDLACVELVDRLDRTPT